MLAAASAGINIRMQISLSFCRCLPAVAKRGQFAVSPMAPEAGIFQGAY